MKSIFHTKLMFLMILYTEAAYSCHRNESCADLKEDKEY